MPVASMTAFLRAFSSRLLVSARPSMLSNRILRIEAHLDGMAMPTARGRGRPHLPAIVRAPDIAKRIEHTALKPDATPSSIAALCDDALRESFRGVCINPVFVEQAKQHLAGTGCRVVAVVGFPFGANLTETKAEETRSVVQRGADEIDMVIAIGLLRQARYRQVFSDIETVVAAASGVPVKVILETALLDEDQKIAGCLLAERAGAAYVKTSTGFASGGATTTDVALLRSLVGERLGVKASGGIRDFSTARAMIEAGADVIGTSASVRIASG